MRNRLSSLAFILLILCIFTVSAFAGDGIIPVESTTAYNSLYQEINIMQEVKTPVLFSSGTSAPAYDDYPTTLDQPAAELRSGMSDRKDSITVYYATETGQLDTKELFYMALQETEQPNEGDYLRWSWQKYSAKKGGVIRDNVYYYFVTYTLVYYTTAEEEAVVAEEIDKILTSFAFEESDSDYHKIKTVYDYICANVTYDNEGFSTLNDGDSTNDDYSTVTAHKALTQGKAVCQGYATLFYRMIETLGMDARLIPGHSKGQGHAWNIVKLGNHYFNVDATWDSGRDSKGYFLKSDATFAREHIRSADFATESFYAVYPMGCDLVSEEGIDSAHHYNAVITAPSCTAEGYTTFTCGCGLEYKGDFTGKIAHSYVSDVTAPTCVAQGYTTYTCICGDTYTGDYTQPIGHSYSAKVTEPTCAARGFTTYTCHCGDQYYSNYIDPISHIWDSGRITKEPTEKEQGVTTYTCKKCNATKEHYIAKLVNPFVDILDTSDTNWYYRPVLWAVDNEITTGIDSTHFMPNGVCTRAQIVTFLWRAAGEPVPKNDNMPFLDVSGDQYYYDAVLWAVENGITMGVDSTHFAPDAECTRGQVVTFLWRSAGKPIASGRACNFDDTQEGAYYYDAVLWAVEEAITNGLDAVTFGVENTCTRAHVVTFLYRYHE